MPDLVAGSRIKAVDYTPAAGIVDDANYLDISTSYTFGGVAEATFVAPTSGRVLLIVGAGANPGASQTVNVAPEVYEGVDATGTLIVSAHAGLRGVIIYGSVARITVWSRITLLEGLVPERTHYARAVFRGAGGTTSDLLVHSIFIAPVP